MVEEDLLWVSHNDFNCTMTSLTGADIVAPSIPRRIIVFIFR